MRRQRGTGSLFRRPRSPFYWMQYYRDGKCYRESTHERDERKALRVLDRRIKDAASDTFIAPQTARVRVVELAEDFVRDQKICERKATADAEARWRLHLKPFFGHLRAVSVGSDAIFQYILFRQQEGAKNATVNRELACLRRMFNLGAQASPAKVIRVPKFPHLAERNVRAGFLEDSEYQRLAEASARVALWMRALFETGYNYGWRIGELLRLRVRQIDLVSRTIRLNPGETKNDEGRIVVMTDTVHQLLSQCVIGKMGDDRVFTRPNGRPVVDLRATWSAVCREAGVPTLLFHDLRRTAVRNMVRAGIPERVAMQISGHKTRAIFDRYNIVSEGDLRDAARKLEGRASRVEEARAAKESGSVKATSGTSRPN